ncbi:MAG: FtsK/SpoIIIE domain-containing protein, partial [Planctomycetota bacterium]
SDEAVALLQTVMFRLLTSLPPGKVRFTIIDPVGLGQNFAGFMHLADYLEALVTDRIWTEPRHIEQRLSDLTDHMENVIQKYLRNEYATIADYNEQAGEIAEPYRFLVIANFPVNMSDNAAKRLASIMSSGARCGVYTLLSVDRRQAVPRTIELADMRRQSINLVYEDDHFAWKDDDYGELPLVLDGPPDAEFMIDRLNQVGAAARDSSRVEVPFEMVAPPDEDRWWSASSASDLRVPLGRSGATSLQYLELGRGTSQHVLIAGKTGSGKSTLLHVLITSTAIWYSPDEVELYLVDFKKGVEFKPYATRALPHARAVAIESDREFGLSILQQLDEELKRRGDCFRERGAQDLASYRASEPATPMPRTLLIIDEFQEFFVEDDKIAQDAALLLDRLVRQGRAFGIHVILGSQTLGGAYSLAKSTMGQMAVRIALQCSETDSYLIMNEDNSAARLLSRPGEAIYNDESGQIEGNSPFQIVWLSDETKAGYLDRLAARAELQPGAAGPAIVFEGSAPADVTRNRLLTGKLAASAPDPPGAGHPAWLGEAVAIKDPTAAVFRRQTGHNMLVVGQREEAVMAILSVGLVSLAAGQLPVGGELTAFSVLDGLPADSPYRATLDHALEALPQPARRVGRRDLSGALQTLADEVERRQQKDVLDDPPLYLFIFGLQRFRDLRSSDSFGFSFGEEEQTVGPDRLFQQVLRDGPSVGVHCIVWCDTAINVDRSLDRQMLREFDMRVVFQMSAADSTNLIDNPVANKIGLHHAIFYSEEQGIIEKFRPYGLPDAEWFAEVARRLAAKAEARA